MSNHLDIVFVWPFEVLHGYPPRSCLSRDNSRTLTLPASWRRGPLGDSTEDRRIGLNIYYSIIFTEISFSPETSILLQLIQIIHMTFWIMPEFDREGRAVCQFWLQGGKHNVTLTDKKIRLTIVTLGSSGPPPLLGRREGTTRFPEKQPKMNT